MVMTFGAEVAVGAGGCVGAGAEVAAGADVDCGACVAAGVAAPPQAARTMLESTSTASKAYNFRFTVSPPTENLGFGRHTPAIWFDKT